MKVKILQWVRTVLSGVHLRFTTKIVITEHVRDAHRVVHPYAGTAVLCRLLNSWGVTG